MSKQYYAEKPVTVDGRSYNPGEIVTTKNGEGVDGLRAVEKGDISQPSREQAPVNGVAAGAPMPNSVTPDVREAAGQKAGETADGSKPEDRDNSGATGSGAQTRQVREGERIPAMSSTDAASKPGNEGDIMDHLVTKEDLEANPALGENGVKAGDTVQYHRKADGEGYEYRPAQG